MDNVMNKLEYINEKAIENPQEFINECEKKYERIIDLRSTSNRDFTKKSYRILNKESTFLCIKTCFFHKIIRKI